jgi:hypothetical protein
VNSPHELIANKMHLDGAVAIFNHFFGITRGEGGMQSRAPSKRGSANMTEKSIMHALGLQCSCSTQCSDRWNKGNIRQARRYYDLMTKLEQLHKVYEILLGARNTITGDITLMVGGLSKFFPFLIFQVLESVRRPSWPIMAFPPTNSTLL